MYPNGMAYRRQCLRQNNTKWIDASMCTLYKFGRINLNIQIEIGLYDENVSLFFRASCLSISSHLGSFFLVWTQKVNPKTIYPYSVAYALFWQTEKKIKSESYTTHSTNKLFGSFILYWSIQFDSRKKRKKNVCLQRCPAAGIRKCCQCVTNRMFTFDYLFRVQFPFSHLACCDSCVRLYTMWVLLHARTCVTVYKF